MFGWKAKAEKLRTTLVSAGHQPAIPLHPSIVGILDGYRRAAKATVPEEAFAAMEAIRAHTASAPIPDGQQPIYEPLACSRSGGGRGSTGARCSTSR